MTIEDANAWTVSYIADCIEDAAAVRATRIVIRYDGDADPTDPGLRWDSPVTGESGWIGPTCDDDEKIALALEMLEAVGFTTAR